VRVDDVSAPMVFSSTSSQMKLFNTHIGAWLHAARCPDVVDARPETGLGTIALRASDVD